jgi:hypothetical protein
MCRNQKKIVENKKIFAGSEQIFKEEEKTRITEKITEPRKHSY